LRPTVGDPIGFRFLSFTERLSVRWKMFCSEEVLQ